MLIKLLCLISPDKDDKKEAPSPKKESKDKSEEKKGSLSNESTKGSKEQKDLISKESNHSKENSQNSSKGKKGIECGKCSQKTKWIQNKGVAKTNEYTCNSCKKDFVNPCRFYCYDHFYNICPQCSQVANKEKCGCGELLDFEDRLDRYCGWCDKKVERGWKCSQQCKYVVCESCRPKNDPTKEEKKEDAGPNEKRYKREELLGSGAFGKVFRCVDTTDKVVS